MQRHAFQLTRPYGPIDAPENQERAELSELRNAVRDAIARGITLVLDQERFLDRVAAVIAESAGYPTVAAYVHDPLTGHLVLGGATRSPSEGIPARLTSSSIDYSESRVIAASEILDHGVDDEGSACLIIPLRHRRALEGAIIIFDVAETLSDHDLEAFDVVAVEIAPAVRVAKIHEALRDAVVKDIATGAFTYEYFTERLVQETSRALRRRDPVSVVLIEFNDWERLEREAGYLAADRVLTITASSIATAVRNSDVVARRGRSGFAVLLLDSDRDGAHVTIRRIIELHESRGESLLPNGPQDLSPKLAAGWASLPDDGQSSADLLLVADQRLLANIGASTSDE